jgi:hydroxymethylglutaryl-CoA synthase
MIGIVGYGSYIPRFRIKVEEIAKVWSKDPETIKNGLILEEKSVPDADEDTITLSAEASRNALLRARVDPEEIGAVFIGSESHPDAVKPSGVTVAEALGITPNVMVADFRFACKAGTAAMQCCYALVKSGEVKYAMAIGADCAQGRPGDALEYTAAAGAASFIIGPNPLAELEGTYSYATDTADFWRREGREFPRHAGRFTGEPAYFEHIMNATKGLFEKLGIGPRDFDYAVFHQPNGKFPLRVAKKLGFEKEKIMPGFLVPKIGNCYSGSSPLGLCAVLDIAQPGERILLTSYGSGAGSDSFSFKVTDKILERRNLAPSTGFYVNRKAYIDYGTYVRLRRKLKM